MILTTHALVGAAIGKYVSSPFLQILILIPFHYILDTFRHGEYLGQQSKTRKVSWKVALDISFGLSIIGLYAIFFHPTTQTIKAMFLGAFISMFPDFITFLHWKLQVPYLGKIYQFHQWVHKFKRGSIERIWTFRDAINDIVFSIIAIIFLFL